ncbi:fk506 binding protein, putative [Perkinsus marinus ATCC 50983]|uniref:Fk506 binding protein, putative n=1 Tax=Perkinsus marinus (strain ATCC 50983 / TXsc) TaxID=423536 RepID=C5K719_PERM5|nr:fk506 binding protein, putative [Perkinsus marinus ATCC 50983]EER19354.1 fk506 binding protein, putative [Perkinsus marinus ATCC 50983]|eukprot:XP_002787558.1 fk506 binding protein, putative [Perkinsus marinus ATCC 50983]
MQTQSPVKPPKKEGQSETEKTLRPTPRPDAMMAASPALSDLSIAIVVAVAGLLVTAACCVMCYGWRNRKRGGVYQLGVTQEPYSHRFGDTDDDWSSSASSEQPHDIEEGDGSRSREMDLLGEEERPTGPSGRGGMDFARVPIELWEDLRRCLSRALREKRAARDEAAKSREALKGYKQLGDLEFRIAKLKAERIELVRDRAIIESDWSSRYSLVKRLNAVLAESQDWYKSLEGLSDRVVVGEGLRRKLEVGMAAVEGRAPSVGIEPATSTSMKACKMVYRSTKQTSGRLYVVIVWHHLCRHHHHRPETKLQQASCPHGGTFIAPEGLLDGYCPPPPPPRLHYSSPVLSGTVLARALLEGVHEGLSSSLICIITDLEGTNLMEEIDLAEETSDAVVSALASGVSMGVEGRINSTPIGRAPPVEAWIPVVVKETEDTVEEWMRLEVWLLSFDRGLVVLRLLDPALGHMYTLGVCVDTDDDDKKGLIETIASRLVGVKTRVSGGRLIDILLAPLSTTLEGSSFSNPELGGLWNKLSMYRDRRQRDLHGVEEESREAANTSVKTTSMLRPVTDIRAIMTPAESPCAAVVNRLISWRPADSIASENALLRLSAAQRPTTPLLMIDVVCYAPMTGKTIAIGQLEMVELCRSVVKAPEFSKTGDTLSQVVKAAIEGRSLKIRPCFPPSLLVTSKPSSDCSQLLWWSPQPEKWLSASEKALPTVTNPTPYSNDYSKFQRMEAEMKAKEEAELEMAKREEDLRQAQERCPLDHEHGPECVELMRSGALGGCSHDHRKEQQLYDMPTKDKLQGADTMRQKANEYLREGNCGLAAVWYRKALLNFDYCFPDSKVDREWFNASKLKCHVSFAICKYKLEDFDEVLSQTHQALKIDHENVKALYWQGMVFMKYKDDYTRAKKSLLAAYRLCPTDPQIRAALNELKCAKREYASKTSKLAKTMITQSHDKEEEGGGNSEDGGQPIESVVEEEEVPETSPVVENESSTGTPSEDPQPSSVTHVGERTQRDKLERLKTTVLKLLVVAVTILIASLAYLLQSMRQRGAPQKPIGLD